MMPYLAPDATIPRTSCAPKLAEINARLVIQSGILLLLFRKSLLDLILLLMMNPTAITNTK
jgi:hypothetical protein